MMYTQCTVNLFRGRYKYKQMYYMYLHAYVYVCMLYNTVW